MVSNTHKPNHTECYAAISVARDTEALLFIAKREGWQALEHNHGPFRVVEFWLENRVLIEFFTPEMEKEHSNAVTSFVRGAWD